MNTSTRDSPDALSAALPARSSTVGGGETDPDRRHGAAEMDSTGQVQALWADVWGRLGAAHVDLEGRLARLPKSGVVARLEASAGRRAARVLRGELAMAEFATRLREWERAAADALASEDQRRSLSTCSDCGAEDTETVATALQARCCTKCLKKGTT